MPGSIIAASKSEYRAARDRALPPIRKIGANTWVLPLQINFPNGSVPYTLCYVLKDAEGWIHLIDPGVDDDANLGRIAAFLQSIGSDVSRIRSSIATHLHMDHLPMALRLRAETGAAVVMHERDSAGVGHEFDFLDDAVLLRWGVPPDERLGLASLRSKRRTSSPPDRADRVLEGGDLLTITGRDVEVLWTPGHTPGHICLIDRGEGLVFTGDHVLPDINPGLGLGDGCNNPLDQYFDSLERISLFDDLVVCPGHGYLFHGLATRCSQIYAHHQKRAVDVAHVLETHPDLTTWEVAKRVPWTGGWDRLAGFKLTSALAQTEMHAARVRNQQQSARRTSELRTTSPRCPASGH